MTMLLQSLSLTMAYLAVAHSREIGKPAPTISNSLVNLGKMEISFYLNGHEQPNVEHTTQAPPVFIPKSEPIYGEPCPCSSLRNLKDSFSNPSGMLNNLLMNNDLFSANKEPVSSTLCCESHEHIEEGTVVFEFPPLNQKGKPTLPKVNPMPVMPFIFENLAPKNPMSPLKTKSIEIFLFPKKKEGGIDFTKLQQKKKEVAFNDEIKIVGDKDVKKTFASIPTPPPSIKKDVREETIETEKEKEKEDMNKNMYPANNINAV